MLASLAERVARSIDSPAASDFVAALRESASVAQLLAGKLLLVWASARMVSDPPSRVMADKATRRTLPSSLADVIGQTTQELQIVSPYFVPTQVGAEALKALRQQGVRLCELRRTSGASKVQLFTGLVGSSTAIPHAKTLAVDGERLFVGSFNFDPRSAALNTEPGFVIESPAMAMAREVAAAFDHAIPERAYELRLADDGAIAWTERANGDTITHTCEPGTGPLQRMVIGILPILPINWPL